LPRALLVVTRVSALLVALLAAAPTADAQAPTKVWRIGQLDYGPDPASSARWKALRDRLSELGYVEGHTVVFEARSGDGQTSRLPALAAELVDAKVDLIVTAGTEAAAAARRATRSVPIVTATGGNLVAGGIVSSLARPGGNITGVISMTGELGGKRLELLRLLVPRISRVGVLRNPDNRGTRAILTDVERGAMRAGVVVQVVGVQGPTTLEGAFSTLKHGRAEAVILAENTLLIAHRQRLAELAVTHRLPMIAAAREYAEAGVLASYGTDYAHLFRRAADYVDRIVKGAAPAALPIEQPTKFEFVVNVKTAKALGLTIPPSVLAQADQLIGR
jgi:putative ABC transport system substrate-binding protein